MADDKKRLIPKRINGEKLPKDVRRAAEALTRAVLDNTRGADGGPHDVTAVLNLMNVTIGAVMDATVREAFGSGPATPSRPEPPLPRRRPPSAPPIPPEPVTPPRPPFPPMPPAGAARTPGERPDWDRIADELGRGAEQVLGRLFGGKR